MNAIAQITTPMGAGKPAEPRPGVTQPPPERYHMLDGMRGIAAIIVMLHHLGSAANVGIAHSGSLAVDFFFALSGFVLASAYTKKLGERISFAEFSAMRFIRLYPLLFVGMSFGVLKGMGQTALHDNLAMSGPHLALAVVLGFLVLPNLTNAWLFPLNAPIWSLFLEVLVNIAFALGLYRLKKAGLVAVCAVSGLCLASSTIALGDADGGDQWNALWHAAARVTFSFSAGMLIWHMRRGKQRRRTWISLLPALCLVCALLPSVSEAAKPFYDVTIIVIVLPAIVYAGAAWDIPARGQPTTTILGDVSYPVYVVHYPIVGMSWVAMRNFVSPPVYLFGTAVLVIGLSWLLARKVDEPLRAKLTRALLLHRSEPHRLPARSPAQA